VVIRRAGPRYVITNYREISADYVPIARNDLIIIASPLPLLVSSPGRKCARSSFCEPRLVERSGRIVPFRDFTGKYVNVAGNAAIWVIRPEWGGIAFGDPARDLHARSLLEGGGRVRVCKRSAPRFAKSTKALADIHTAISRPVFSLPLSPSLCCAAPLFPRPAALPLGGVTQKMRPRFLDAARGGSAGPIAMRAGSMGIICEALHEESRKKIARGARGNLRTESYSGG